MKTSKHLCSLCASFGIAMIFAACGPSTPQEKVIDSFNDAIERVDKAKTQQSLNAASQILIGDINKALKGLTAVDQNKVMTSREVAQVEAIYNRKITEKRKSVR